MKHRECEKEDGKWKQTTLIALGIDTSQNNGPKHITNGEVEANALARDRHHDNIEHSTANG